MRAPVSRKQLCAEGLLKEARRCFSAIGDKPGCEIPPADHPMSGLSLFGLKYTSLLQFEEDCRNGAIGANLGALYWFTPRSGISGNCCSQ